MVVHFRRALNYLSRFWPAVTTLVIAALAIGGIFLFKTPEQANLWSQYLSGVVSLLAFLWLVASYRIQSIELSLQRDELKLQRIALEQQARELSNSAKLGSLEQIRSILDEAKSKALSSDIAIKNLHELPGKWAGGMIYWIDVLESRDPEIVQQAHTSWLKIEAPARIYLSDVASAMKIYIEYHTNQELDHSLDPENFVYIYQSWVNKAPFLGTHAGPAAILANFVFLTKPAVEAMLLAMMVANALILGRDLMKDGALEEMRDKLISDGRDLPAICDPWPNFPPRKSAAGKSSPS